MKLITNCLTLARFHIGNLEQDAEIVKKVAAGYEHEMHWYSHHYDKPNGINSYVNIRVQPCN